MKRKILFVTGAVALTVLLAGAAFVGARLLAQPSGPGDLGGLGGLLAAWTGAPGRAGRAGYVVRIELERSEELPARPAEAEGVFLRHGDGGIFIGTGNVMMGATKSGNGKGETSVSYDGPEVEVVITRDTTIYRDATELPDNPTGEITVQQVLEPGSASEIGEDSMVMAWGTKSGDRIIAQVLVYSEPKFMMKKK